MKKHQKIREQIKGANLYAFSYPIEACENIEQRRGYEYCAKKNEQRIARGVQPATK